jgi:hypothetical protein
MAYGDWKKTFVVADGTTSALAKTAFDTAMTNVAGGAVSGILGVAILDAGIATVADSQAASYTYTAWAQISYQSTT